ncbi:dynein heavy chain 5, axonemal-like isoform X2 [Anneissia japonica]|uniref:dynein heavy chain 5, axonemal-like isoform X2 n=1 Tax=Anneissia japonica TaxID=1529436 RepID=UPI00142578E1|nr:dynein heavy chain 5, axonemal-like isoform X2 [Anneissia japonica]
MDERHWWIATKIQESFHIGGFSDNPTLLEDFLCESETLDLINKFLGEGGPNKLFFYSDRPQTSALTPSGLQSTRQLHVITSLAKLKDVDVEQTTVLYMLRHTTEHEVDQVHMEKDIFCGELRHSVLENLNTLLSDIYLPLLQAQTDWGHCTPDQVSQCLNSLDKHAAALAETVKVPNTAARQQVLRRPEILVSNEFSKHRSTSYDGNIISEYEALVTEWISTIDNALTDGGDERFMDPNSGPLTELERWKRRQRMLSSIMEQLKGKECKTVIGVLISSKSKVIKKWKLIDASITDAANETKDKVKYLEALRRHFEQLYNGATPASIVNTALPGLVNSVKQMDSISRFYARGGYLGLLFTKITNQLVNACKDYLRNATISTEQEDQLWPKMYGEIDTKVASGDLISKPKTTSKRKGKEKDADADTLFGRMKSCLNLYNSYKEMVRCLRDSLGGAHALTHFPSISSIGAPTSKSSRGFVRGYASKPSKTPSVAGDFTDGHGIPFTDEESIFGHMDSFCGRVRQVIDSVYTLIQYSKLIITIEGLPRPLKDDLQLEDFDDVDTTATVSNVPESIVTSYDSPAISISPLRGPHTHKILPVVEEEEGSNEDEDENEDTTGDNEMGTNEMVSNADEVHELAVTSTKSGLTLQDVMILRKLFNADDPEDEGPSISSIVRDHVISMKALLSSNITTEIMLDVEGKEKEKYGEVHMEFQGTVQQIEAYMCAYLHAVFLRKMKTHQSLDILTRFLPVMHRQGVKHAITEKYMDMFTAFETDLEEVKDIYEKYKDEPIKMRNAPPVAGAIQWSRQLLQRIEEPMKVFRDNKAIMHMREFSRIVKFYNRIATALVTFESLWFNHWKTLIEPAKAGLKATLLVVHPETRCIVVNADERVLQMMQECRWMSRLGISVPEAALLVAKQEHRFKSYQNHLVQCLNELNEVSAMIPQPLEHLFITHTSNVIQALQPGLTTLAWNSMNIDAFLHQVRTAIMKLKVTVDAINNITKNTIEAKLKAISQLFLFDIETAFGRSWPPGTFTENMLASVNQRKKQLQEYVSDIEIAVYEIIHVLIGERAASAHSNTSMTPSLKHLSTRRGKMTTQMNETTSPDDIDYDVPIGDMLALYSDHVYEAVLSSICRSLITLAEASGCEGVMEHVMSELTSTEQNTPYLETITENSSHAFSPSPVLGNRLRSRVGTGTSRLSDMSLSDECSRPTTSLSYLSDLSWTAEKTLERTYLQFEVEVKFAIPNIVIEPGLDSVCTALTEVGKAVLKCSEGFSWWAGENASNMFEEVIGQEPVVITVMHRLDNVVHDLQKIVDNHVLHFRFYDFLWQDNMHGTYFDFISNDPGMHAIQREVERLLHIEEKIQAIPKVLPVGSICLQTSPIKDALYGFAVQWKSQYAQSLHEEAKRRLDQALMYRTNVVSKLSSEVKTLDQLNGALNLLEEVRDMENKIDGIYLPIETMYTDLRSYNLRLPRSEVEEVSALRDKWQDVIDLAENCRIKLLKERRGAFEQELDKQVKLFVVEVIQFRNSFDSQGPAVPGVQPAEAVSRLHEFLEIYKLYDSKRKTLDSVSRLFGINCKPFPELDKTGEELDLLGLLYGLFQKFIAFDAQFRDRLWAEAELQNATLTVEGYWEECQNLPEKLKDWDAYNEMKNSIQFYLDVFPILHKLASKEIRNRHWLQVMSVTGSSFQLEANVFKLSHILDIGLMQNQKEIEEICHCASKELELEVKLRITEEEWTEQVLMFQNYKKRGPIYLEKDNSEHLLEQLEDAQALLANMLTSRHVGPLREEAASWAEKLKGVAEVLEQWLEVQDLWLYLEAVFSVPMTAKELPQEAKRFNRIDKSWTKIMKRAYDTRNVLQCTYGGDVPKGVVLRHIYEELEICFKSLVGYLDNKRKAFPRFYFMSDPVLLAILSRPNDLESVRPHHRCIFNNVYDIRLERISVPNYSSTVASPLRTPHGNYHSHEHSPTHNDRGHPNILNGLDRYITPSVAAGRISQDSEGGVSESNTPQFQAVAVVSKEGEVLPLQNEVTLTEGVEVWLKELKDCIGDTIYSLVCNVIEDVEAGIAVEDLALKYPGQVARLGMLMYWTKECEIGIAEIRNDRKAIPNACKKFITNTSRLSAVLSRGMWKNTDEQMTFVHRQRLESLIAQSHYLRDTLEHMANRKLRELGDFEWRRCIRFYHAFTEGKVVPYISILEKKYTYGSEFYGARSSLVLTPTTERCFITMSMCMKNQKGCMLVGGTGIGKTETTKGLASTLGRFLAMFACSPHSDPQSLGKIMQGLALDGSWACLDEFQLLQPHAVAMVMDHCQGIIFALRSGVNKCIVSNGEEIVVNRDTALFMTVNNTHAHSNPIGSDVKTLFRSISLTVPDLAMILKAKCAGYGFKAPKILADRLKIVIQQCKEQLPPEEQHYVNLSSTGASLLHAVKTWHMIEGSKEYQQLFALGSISSVVQFASAGRKLTKEERAELSRASSQISLAQTQSLMPPLGDKQASNVTIKSQKDSLTMSLGPRKQGMPNPMTAAARTEHAVVAQALQHIIAPRLKADACYIFNNVIKDVFSGTGEAPLPQSSRAHRSRLSAEHAIIAKAQENGLVAHASWINKIMQLYSVSQVNHAIIVAGEPGTGKSTCIQTLIDGLSAISSNNQSRQSRSSSSTISSVSHKLQRINPLVVDDLALMFGYLNQNRDWIDGIFTSAWRKANRNVSTTWLCLDGPLTPSWADNFNSVLDGDKVLHLRNGDKLFLADNIKLLFETTDLNTVSPATVARSGIVYFDKDILGWRPIAQAWMEGRNQQEIHCLQKAFNKTMDAVVNFVIYETKPRMYVCEVGMFQMCLGLLTAMLNEINVSIGGELHIERLFLFCLIWSFGSLLEGNDRKNFSDLLRTLTSALPDYDHEISVFDYYVDEAGEWDPWISRVPEVAYTDNQDLLGEFVIDTVDTIQARVILEFANLSNLHMILVGPPGSGKTSMINDFIDSLDPPQQVSKHLVFSGASSASQLQQFVENNIRHRQGFVYGAKDNKRLQIFIDDISLPTPDEFGVQRCNELLRQLMDDKILVTLHKPFEWRTIEGLHVLASMTTNEFPSVNNRLISSRLLRHFAIFYLPEPKDSSLHTIVDAVLDGNMTKNNQQSLAQELHDCIVDASCQLLTSVQNVLRPSPMPGRHHYIFTLRDITKAFQGLMRLSEESREEASMVISLWKYEVTRIIADRICRTADFQWLEKNMENIIKEHFPMTQEEGFELYDHFVTFPIESRTYQRPVTSMSQKTVRVLLQPVTNLVEVHRCLLSHLTRYNEEFGNIQLNIMLSDHVIHHVIRMHRILSFHHGGSMLLVGAIGSHLTSLVNMALHVADMPIHPIDTSKNNSFFDGLRSAVRLSGTEGKMLTLRFTGQDLRENVYLDAINSLLVCGEYPPLFSNDELDGLLLALGPAMKRNFPRMVIDPMKFFVSRVKCNLHIILCLPPTHKLLRIASSQYPGLLKGMQVNWMCDWLSDALTGEASYYVQKHSLCKDSSPDMRTVIVSCMAKIHSHVLHDCNQIPWAGETNDKITLTQVKIQGKKETIKVTNLEVDNLPYTKSIMRQKIELRHRKLDEPGKHELFVGPRTFRRFMDCFKYLYTTKSKENTTKVNQLKKALACLSKTREDARAKKAEIVRLQKLFEEASEKTATLLKQLSSKATVLEKTKALYQQSHGSLNAFLQMADVESDEEEQDDLLMADDKDEYDKEFDRLREQNLKCRQVAIEEELIQAAKRVEECRTSLQKACEQVIHWKDKVDRACIERLRSFQNPTPIVLQVLEMIMALLGKSKPVQPERSEKLNFSSEDASIISGRTSSTGTKSPTKNWKGSKSKDNASEKHKWKQLQVIMNDSNKFVELLHNISWENGLDKNILMNVEYFLPKTKEGEGVTGEGSLLDVPGGPKLPPSSRKSPSAVEGITIAATRYSSEDAGTLVAYTCGIVEYSHLCGPLQQALDRLQELQKEKIENEKLQIEKEEREAREAEEQTSAASVEPEKEYTEADIPSIQDELDVLQKEFDDAVREKHSLEIELVASNERLRAAVDMIHSLREAEKGWKDYVDENSVNQLLLSTCLSASAFLTYCGGMQIDLRKRLASFFMDVCTRHNLPVPRRKLFKHVQIIEFLFSKVKIESFRLLNLPMTPVSCDNACFIMQELSSTAWPLLCDPTSRVLEWLKAFKADKLTKVKYHELRSQLETCLTEGSSLVITDCDVVALTDDYRFYQVLRKRMVFMTSKLPFKMMVADHEVECNPSFRLYLHTTNQPHTIPHSLAAYTSVQYFYQTAEDCEEELLDRFMQLEKARLEEDRITYAKEKIANMQQLEDLEKQMLECLAGDKRLLNDLQTTKKLAEMKKHYNETLESQERVLTSERAIRNAKESYRSIAKRGAVCFNVARGLTEINPIYQSSWQQFLEVYDASIKHSERTAVKAVVERLTFSACMTVSRSLLERDRIIHSVLLSMEVEDSVGNIGPGEREFIVSPQLGAAVMSSIGKVAPPDHKVTQAKKPFDWMSDDQFQNLQLMAMHFDWFQEMFDRMSKDGRETQWRTLGEHETPENYPLPERMDDVYNPMQRFMILRAFRPDRIMQASTVFVSSVLGKKYVTESLLDLASVLRQSSPTTPILLMYTCEAQLATKLFTEFANKKQMKTTAIFLTGASQNEDRQVRKVVITAMQEGSWVLLQNGQNASNLLKGLESILKEHDNSQGEGSFRLWISAEMKETIPVRLLQYSFRVVVDSPQVMRENLIRGISLVDTDMLKTSSRSEWPPLLHNLIMLHGTLRLRARFGRSGWNLPQVMNFKFKEIAEGLSIAKEVFKDVPHPDGDGLKGVSWIGLRYMLTEIVYGSSIQDEFDQTNLAAMVDYWIGPNAVKREFEATKLKYKLPSAFFNNVVRPHALIQACEAIPNHMLDVPEATGVHSSTEDDGRLMTYHGDDQYVFTRLNMILDNVPSTKTLAHIFERPSTPTTEPSVSSVTGQAMTSSVRGMGVYASASVAAIRSRKDVEIWEVCHTALLKLPRGWNRDYISERIRKIGGDTPFNRFILREVDMMITLLAEMRSTLQKLKNLTENPTEMFGDLFSDKLIDVADDMFHLRLPLIWRNLAGDSAPPATWQLGQWLTDLAQRCLHLEKIIIQGREKFPAFWLGAFFQPKGLLALLRQDAMRAYGQNGAQMEPFIFQTEITARDKDHVRDPPQEGMFVYGIYIWGCTWEKTTGELQDLAPRHGPTPLPIIHIICIPASEKQIVTEPTRYETFSCPVYPTRVSPREPVFLMDVRHDSIPPSRWSLRGLAATIRPF